MDLALNNLQRLICRKIQTTNQPTNDHATSQTLHKNALSVRVHC